MFARRLAGDKGKVHVSLDSDSKIEQDKGKGRPIFGYNERFKMVRSLDLVDMIHFHDNNDDLLMGIRRELPDVIIVGSDYEGKPVVGSNIASVFYFKKDEISTSNLIERIRKSYD